MHIAVFLPLNLMRTSYKTVAMSALHQHIEWLRRSGLLLGASASSKHALHLVKHFLVNYAFVLALMHFASVFEMSVIKHVRQHILRARRVPLLAARRLWVFFGLAPSARLYAIGIQKSGDVVERFCACGVEFKRSDYNRRIFLVDDNRLGLDVVEIADRRKTRTMPLAHLLAQASFGIDRQIIDILLGRVKLVGKHVFTLRGVLKPKVRKLQITNDILVEHIDNPSAIYAVARQSVWQPCQNPVCFAVFYALEHFVKLRAPWLLGGLFFYDDARDMYSHAPSKLFEFDDLRRDRQHLFVLNVGTFADI